MITMDRNRQALLVTPLLLTDYTPQRYNPNTHTHAFLHWWIWRWLVNCFITCSQTSTVKPMTWVETNKLGSKQLRYKVNLLESVTVNWQRFT